MTRDTMKRMIILILFLLHAAGCGNSGGKVFFINSYHEGYGSSDDITEGIVETMAETDVQLEIFYMDTKRNTDEPYALAKADEALRAIERFQPDVIIASDDNAVKYVIEPNFKGGPIPCVFCGVNWSAEKYGLPTANVTGMLEVLPLEDSIALIRRYYHAIGDISIITENSLSEQSSREYLEPVFVSMGLAPDFQLVNTFEEWQSAFSEANQTADCIFIPTNGAVRNWVNETARVFVHENIKVPVFTCDDFMMPYAVFGLTKVAREQGEWAAETALRIIGGESPGDIPITRNSQVKMYFNPALAGQIGFTLDESELESAIIVE